MIGSGLELERGREHLVSLTLALMFTLMLTLMLTLVLTPKRWQVLGKTSNYELIERALSAHEESLTILDAAKQTTPHQVRSLDAHRATARVAYGKTLDKCEKHGVAATLYKQAVRILVDIKGYEDSSTIDADRLRAYSWSLHMSAQTRGADVAGQKAKGVTMLDGRPTSRGNLHNLRLDKPKSRRANMRALEKKLGYVGM